MNSESNYNKFEDQEKQSTEVVDLKVENNLNEQKLLIGDMEKRLNEEMQDLKEHNVQEKK